MAGTVAVLTFRPDGSGRGLWTDAIPLANLGRLTVRRVSRIDWSETRQVWEIRPARGGHVMHRDTSRAACVDWERLHFGNLK